MPLGTGWHSDQWSGGPLSGSSLPTAPRYPGLTSKLRPVLLSDPGAAPPPRLLLPGRWQGALGAGQGGWTSTARVLSISPSAHLWGVGMCVSHIGQIASCEWICMHMIPKVYTGRRGAYTWVPAFIFSGPGRPHPE